MGGWQALSFRELFAFGRATKRLSTPWDYETARHMSVAYTVGLSEGRDVFSIPPFQRDDD